MQDIHYNSNIREQKFTCAIKIAGESKYKIMAETFPILTH